MVVVLAPLGGPRALAWRGACSVAGLALPG